MRFWFDTEFDEDGRTIELISIGMVAEDGREFYAVSTEFDPAHCNPWVQEHVLAQLPPRGNTDVWLPRAEIARRLLEFVGDKRAHLEQGKPEFWAYYADYDWVVLCQLFGRMIDLPKGWPMYCRDLKQWADDLGNPELPKQGKGEHNALADAWWNRIAFDFLNEYEAATNGRRR